MNRKLASQEDSRSRTHSSKVWLRRFWTGCGLRTALFLLVVFHVFSISAIGAPAPRRVVSLNVCTDQLAMLIADAGQLHSVSHLAVDPESSVLTEEARAFVINHGLAEEIFMMQPDLVLAGTFTSQATVAMLRRLGFRVETFPPSYSLAEIRDQIKRMGQLLSREDRAEDLINELDRRLDQASSSGNKAWRPLAALYYANSYTSGSKTLSNEVVRRSGLDNLAERLGLTGIRKLPLEVLVMSAPDMVIESHQRNDSPALAFERFEHPALRAVLKNRPLTSVPDKYWICGAPFTAEAVQLLSAHASSIREEGHERP